MRCSERIRCLLWLVLLLVLSACASRGPGKTFAPTRSVAIIGVTQAPGIEPVSSSSTLSRELQELIIAGGGYRVMRSIDVKRAVNAPLATAYKNLVTQYAKRGELRTVDLKALVDARLPVNTALIIRIEQNRVRAGMPKRVQLRNNAGDVLTDRERVVLSTVREMQLRASMVNVESGRVFWTRSYRSTPSAENAYTLYSGSSFSGSLAASFANTMTNGLKVPSGPAAPSTQLTLRALLREVVRHLPR